MTDYGEAPPLPVSHLSSIDGGASNFKQHPPGFGQNPNNTNAQHLNNNNHHHNNSEINSSFNNSPLL